LWLIFSFDLVPDASLSACQSQVNPKPITVEARQDLLLARTPSQRAVPALALHAATGKKVGAAMPEKANTPSA